VVAVTFLHAAAWLSLIVVIFLVFLAFGDWLHTLELRRDRERLREHRRRMDSLEPQRWTYR
jgi:hypothetical protein